MMKAGFLEYNVPDLLAKWERDCDLRTAAKWRKSVYAMADALCQAADCLNPVLIGNDTTWLGGSA